MVNLFQILNQLKIQASTSDRMSIIAIINAMRKILEISSRSDEKAIYDCIKNRFKTFYNNTFLCS
jgi:ribonuclease HI